MASSSVAQCLKKIVDILVALVLIGPFVAIFWRATWFLMDVYICPDSKLRSGVICTAVGLLFSHLTIMLQGQMVKTLSQHGDMVINVVWRLYIYLIAVACVSYWRGIWLLLDEFTPATITSYLLSHFIAFFVLVFTRTACTVISSPGYFLNDMLVSPTCFNVSVMNINSANRLGNLVNLTISSLLTVCVVGTGVVTYWRGTWMACDTLVAEVVEGVGIHSYYGCVTSLGVGYFLCVVCHLTSEPIETHLTSLSSWPYFAMALIEHVFVYVLAFAVVNVWRGAWCMWDYFVFRGSETRVQAAIQTHCVTVVCLYVGQGVTNLVGSPAGCRTHGANTLEGLYMGTFLRDRQPKVIHRPGQPNEVNTRREEVQLEESQGNHTTTQHSMGEVNQVELGERQQENNSD